MHIALCSTHTLELVIVSARNVSNYSKSLSLFHWVIELIKKISYCAIRPTTTSPTKKWIRFLGLPTSKVKRRLLTEHLYSDHSGVRLSVSVARRAPELDRLVGVTRPGYTAQSEDWCFGQHSSRVTHFGPLDPGGWEPSHVTGEIQILPLDDWAIWR